MKESMRRKKIDFYNSLQLTNWFVTVLILILCLPMLLYVGKATKSGEGDGSCIAAVFACGFMLYCGFSAISDTKKKIEYLKTRKQ